MFVTRSWLAPCRCTDDSTAGSLAGGTNELRASLISLLPDSEFKKNTANDRSSTSSSCTEMLLLVRTCSEVEEKKNVTKTKQSGLAVAAGEVTERRNI